MNPGMNGLLKEQPGSQLFTVFGQPAHHARRPGRRGRVHGHDGGRGHLRPGDQHHPHTDADKVAAWFLDGDYDGRTFCITQAFFPDQSAWEKLSKALDGRGRSRALRGASRHRVACRSRRASTSASR